MLVTRIAGIVVSATIVGAAIVAFRPSSDVGYVQINTVPLTAMTPAQLYFDTIRLAPVKNGTALLRQSVGTLTLRADSYGGNLVPLCQIEVKKDRITTIIDNGRSPRVRGSAGNPRRGATLTER